MNPARAIVLAAILAVLAVLAWLISTERSDKTDRALFPELTLETLNEIDRIEIAERGAVTGGVYRGDDGLWRVPGHHDHPADIVKIRRLLSDLQGAEKIEQKTSSPEHYAALGVAGPEAGEGGGKLLTLKDASESRQLILGNPSRQVSGGRYVRKPDEAESWLVNAGFELPAAPAEWLDKDIVHLEPSEVVKATITHAGGKPFTVARGGDGELGIADLPKGRVLKNAFNLKQIASVTDYLQFKSVFPSAGHDIALPKKYITVKIVTANELTLVIKAYKAKDDKTYFMLDADGTSEQAKELKQHLSAWLYEVSSTIYNNVDKRLDDFLKDA